MKARIIREPRCALLWRIDETYPNYAAITRDNGELGAFLDLVKMGGASIPVRSMVTPTSKQWTLANLLLELNTEHETVQGDKA